MMWGLINRRRSVACAEGRRTTNIELGLRSVMSKANLIPLPTALSCVPFLKGAIISHLVHVSFNSVSEYM